MFEKTPDKEIVTLFRWNCSFTGDNHIIIFGYSFHFWKWHEIVKFSQLLLYFLYVFFNTEILFLQDKMQQNIGKISTCPKINGLRFIHILAHLSWKQRIVGSRPRMELQLLPTYQATVPAGFVKLSWALKAPQKFSIQYKLFRLGSIFLTSGYIGLQDNIFLPFLSVFQLKSAFLVRTFIRCPLSRHICPIKNPSGDALFSTGSDLPEKDN